MTLEVSVEWDIVEGRVYHDQISITGSRQNVFLRLDCCLIWCFSSIKAHDQIAFGREEPDLEAHRLDLSQKLIALLMH